jgi:sulfate/thiosulfate transport system ATP-binding protein
MASEVVVPFHQAQARQPQGWPAWQPRPHTGAERAVGRKPALAVRGMSKWFGDELVLNDVNFSIGEGESLVLLGHSGSGKSTTLRLIAGLEAPDTGEISLHGRRIEHLRARARNVGVIFQNYALFPRMSVADNIGFGLRIRGVKRKKRDEVIDRLLGMIGLAEQRDKYPGQISGGQAQRVAIARALAYEPEVLLFDESFSALDPQTRIGLRREIRALLRELRIPALFITHDQEEAMELGDQIAILNRGRLEQIGTPEAVYNDPQTEFVATFLGAANVVEAVWRDGFLALPGDQTLPAPHPMPAMLMQRVKVVFRPEDITLSSFNGFSGYNEAPYHLGRGEVTEVSFTGAAESLMVRLLPASDNSPRELHVKVTRTKWDAWKLPLAPGHEVAVGLKSYKILQG